MKVSFLTFILLTWTSFIISTFHLSFTLNCKVLPQHYKWCWQVASNFYGKEENGTVRRCSDVRMCVTVMKYSLCLARVCIKFRIRIAWIFQQQTIDPGHIISWMTHHRRVLLNIDHSLDWALQSTLPNIYFCLFGKAEKVCYCITLLPLQVYLKIYNEEIFWNMRLFLCFFDQVWFNSYDVCVWLWTHLHWHKDRISLLFLVLSLLLSFPQIITL